MVNPDGCISVMAVEDSTPHFIRPASPHVSPLHSEKGLMNSSRAGSNDLS